MPQDNIFSAISQGAQKHRLIKRQQEQLKLQQFRAKIDALYKKEAAEALRRHREDLSSLAKERMEETKKFHAQLSRQHADSLASTQQNQKETRRERGGNMFLNALKQGFSKGDAANFAGTWANLPPEEKQLLLQQIAQPHIDQAMQKTFGSANATQGLGQMGNQQDALSGQAPGYLAQQDRAQQALKMRQENQDRLKDNEKYKRDRQKALDGQHKQMWEAQLAARRQSTQYAKENQALKQAEFKFKKWRELETLKVSKEHLGLSREANERAKREEQRKMRTEMSQSIKDIRDENTRLDSEFDKLRKEYDKYAGQEGFDEQASYYKAGMDALQKSPEWRRIKGEPPPVGTGPNRGGLLDKAAEMQRRMENLQTSTGRDKPADKPFTTKGALPSVGNLGVGGPAPITLPNGLKLQSQDPHAPGYIQPETMKRIGGSKQKAGDSKQKKPAGKKRSVKDYMELVK